MSDNREVNRREFFKGAFADIARMVVDVVAQKDTNNPPKKRDYLRPPGAVGEGLFSTLCTRCDECIKACPHMCIRGADTDSGARVGSPVIIPKDAACKLCVDFPCIKACKEGALKPVEDIRKVRIGVALIDRRRCLDYVGGNNYLCQQCYKQCPLKDEAIYLEGTRPVVRAERCTGCGICEYICHEITSPSAVKIFVRR
ncbi:MAG: hypothetical protein HZA12_00635 [Nitrospirae bacterium]|nr:hypothetical protein [Nitrospirota bacterium]